MVANLTFIYQTPKLIKSITCNPENLLFFTNPSPSNWFAYEIIGNYEEIAITGIPDKRGEDNGNIIIPNKINNIPVTSIAKSAFRYPARASTVILPDTLVSTGNTAFEDSDLMDTTIPDSVATIAKFALHHGYNNSNPFDGTRIELNIPTSVINIGKQAFYIKSNGQAIKVDENNPNYASKDGVLYTKDLSVVLYDTD